jgi:hypothetical protein
VGCSEEEEVKSMDQAPRAWIGESVDIAFNYHEGTHSGELLEVNEAGIVLEETTQPVDGAVGEAMAVTHHTFFPWSTLMYVMRTISAEERGAE